MSAKISIFHQEDLEITTLLVPKAMLPEFKHAIKRALSTWQDASPEMRQFASELIPIEEGISYRTPESKLLS